LTVKATSLCTGFILIYGTFSPFFSYSFLPA
jgi:hypothetical protein